MPTKQDNVIQELSLYREKAERGLRTGGGGGTSDGMEARLAKVEAALDHIGKEMSDVKSDIRTLRDHARTDFRLLFGAVIAVALGLAALMAKGFRWI